MEYRPFGKLDWKGSVLGFGAMRLPVIGGKMANINEEGSTALFLATCPSFLTGAEIYVDGGHTIA